MEKRKFSKITYSAGSALILAVVLTSLLAIVGTIFLMAARVDKIATSAISENKELNFAVEAVLAKISLELALDVPGSRGAEYYDYPGKNDRWLASLEPYEQGGDYCWRQISDVTGFLGANRFEVEDVNVDPPGNRKYINDYPVITVDLGGELAEQLADADGDGIADSKWIELEGTTSAKGKRIYAAVRVIDNGGMINLNTAHDFDPNGSLQNRIDGSSLTQINLSALARPGDTIDDIDDARNPAGNPLSDYERDCIWRIEDPDIDYLPFDISDELELRNRFLCTSPVETRIEHPDVWESTLDAGGNIYAVPEVPIGQGDVNLAGWEARVDASSPKYERRHILTTYNMDRIIDPCGVKMLNIKDVNSTNVGDVYRTIRDALDDANFADANDVAAQVAVNLIDYRDGPNEPEITTYTVKGKTYYGFESPCIYISELVHRFTEPNVPPGIPIPGTLINRSYAIELHKPYAKDGYPDANDRWQLVIEGYGTFPVRWSGSQSFHVMLFQHDGAALEPEVDFDPADEDPNLGVAAAEITRSVRPGTVVFGPGTNILLRRMARGGPVTVDSVTVKFGPGPPYLVWDVDGLAHSYQRDITLHKCIRRLWDDSFSEENSATLGRPNGYVDASTEEIQAHPADEEFTNVGEIGMLFRKDVYDDSVIKGATEAHVRLNLAVPALQEILKYFTRFDPVVDDIDNDGDGEGETEADFDELKIPGRININTAPWYVMGQLPWIQYGDSTPFEKARAICDYRDNTAEGFESIGQLMRVDEMLSLGSDDVNNLNTDSPRGPDLTDDTCQDDFEERDLIFARISDLVTVRSDVFTAYILVRIGIDGPQKRVIAVLDRSNVYPSGGKVKVAALHPVPDPR